MIDQDDPAFKFILVLLPESPKFLRQKLYPSTEDILRFRARDGMLISPKVKKAVLRGTIR